MPPPYDNRERALIPLLAITFIGGLGFSIVLPFLVFLVQRLGGNALVYGLIGAIYPAFQLLGSPVLGRWSDLYGRKRVLLLSHLGTVIAWILFLIALTLPVVPLFSVDSAVLGTFVITLPILVLFAARALDGITGGNVSVANAYLADITSEQERNKNFGRISIATNLGFILGPALAAILGATAYGEIVPVLAALAVSVVGLGIIIVLLPESQQCVIRSESGPRNIGRILGQEMVPCRRQSEGIPFSRVLRLQYIPYMLLLVFLIFLGFNLFYTAFPLQAAGVLNWDTTQLGIYLSVISILMVIAEGPVLNRLSKRYSEILLIVSGSLILATNFLLLASGNLLLTYIAAVLLALGNGIMWPSTLSLLSRFAGEKYQGSAQGLSNSSAAFAGIIGLIAGGVLYSVMGGMTFFVAALVIFLAFIFALRFLFEGKKVRKSPGSSTSEG